MLLRLLLAVQILCFPSPAGSPIFTKSPTEISPLKPLTPPPKPPTWTKILVEPQRKIYQTWLNSRPNSEYSGDDAFLNEFLTFSFSTCPDPQQIFDTKLWKVIKVLPALKGDGIKIEKDLIDAKIHFERLKKLFFPNKDLLINGKIPNENVILLDDEVLSFTSAWLFPALLKIPFVAHVNIWNLDDSRENGVEFHLDTYGREDRLYTSTIQLHGTRTYLFYTQKDVKAAYDRYLPISTDECIPLHPTLEKLGFLNSQISSFSDCGPGWYENLKALNQLGYFPNDLMPMEITIGPGEILVFDGSMVHATLNSKDGLASVALFG